MRSVNKVILVGNLTRDPELKQTTNGQSIVTFGIATNREWVTRAEDKKSLAEYHNVAAWGRLAEICEQYLKKGKLVYIEGYLKTRSWDSPEGVKIFKTEIVATDMIMLDKRPHGEGEDDFDEFLPKDGESIVDDNVFDPEAGFGDPAVEIAEVDKDEDEK
ncbi:single-stranded DNA-binding protein [Patescibacteria group bacterium]|nr:single-stranded DNA-binding protein [Patescibacteria group bacterium]MBU1682630.1 single-stranded DNA-binding protein [Patescibacteria group bacterium]